uniref:Uncharacterized protein n=1 Tax=Romanomermis culicivorax TaxID=13658 RepID=A0A915IBV6_ROMCU
MISYKANCFFSNSESTSGSVQDDTRASSCNRSRDRLGTLPYRTAEKENENYVMLGKLVLRNKLACKENFALDN